MRLLQIKGKLLKTVTQTVRLLAILNHRHLSILTKGGEKLVEWTSDAIREQLVKNSLMPNLVYNALRDIQSHRPTFTLSVKNSTDVRQERRSSLDRELPQLHCISDRRFKKFNECLIIIVDQRFQKDFACDWEKADTAITGRLRQIGSLFRMGTTEATSQQEGNSLMDTNFWKIMDRTGEYTCIRTYYKEYIPVYIFPKRTPIWNT